MVILGVDPGTLFTGYAVISGVDEALSVIKCDIIKIPSKYKFPARLKLIYDKLVGVIKKYKPDEFAIETAFFSKNVQSTLKLGHARGVSILAAVNKQIPTAEYSPTEIKKSVTGRGSASKEQVKYMVMQTFKLKTLPKRLDVSDAIAVALCHHYMLVSKNFKKKRQNWEEYVMTNPDKVIIK